MSKKDLKTPFFNHFEQKNIFFLLKMSEIYYKK